MSASETGQSESSAYNGEEHKEQADQKTRQLLSHEISGKIQDATERTENKYVNRCRILCAILIEVRLMCFQLIIPINCLPKHAGQLLEEVVTSQNQFFLFRNVELLR